jgi:hypothetical protein
VAVMAAAAVVLRTDIIEGVHTQTQDASTLHTNKGCVMTTAWSNASAVMTGKLGSNNTNCDTNVTSVRWLHL